MHLDLDFASGQSHVNSVLILNILNIVSSLRRNIHCIHFFNNSRIMDLEQVKHRTWKWFF